MLPPALFRRAVAFEFVLMIVSIADVFFFFSRRGGSNARALRPWLMYPQTACALAIEAPVVLSGTPDFEVTQSCPTSIETHWHRQGAGADR
jgi:hypothetical protein